MILSRCSRAPPILERAHRVRSKEQKARTRTGFLTENSLELKSVRVA
jgi:hypothetical protein